MAEWGTKSNFLHLTLKFMMWSFRLFFGNRNLGINFRQNKRNRKKCQDLILHNISHSSYPPFSFAWRHNWKQKYEKRRAKIFWRWFQWPVTLMRINCNKHDISNAYGLFVSSFCYFFLHLFSFFRYFLYFLVCKRARKTQEWRGFCKTLIHSCENSIFN